MTKCSIVKQAGVLGFITCVVAACGELGDLGARETALNLGSFACPELAGGAMNASFDADARANGTIRAFVTASGDLQIVAAKAEAAVGGACERIGRDLGLSPQQMVPPQQGQNRAAATCAAASARIDAILHAGGSAPNAV